ncbi:hypothetical protein [Rhizobium straminoryzae]|uniref:hypothetical protein n=1 Tax=Rhizobium straminoryzae TaxID=1387186 RepID=UPI00163D97E4|nr:hypothetical protein [Rhizobium straminoryzae]
MIKDPANDPITTPGDSPTDRRRKQRGGRGIVTFFILFALGAFAMYLFVVIYGSVASTP